MSNLGTRRFNKLSSDAKGKVSRKGAVHAKLRGSIEGAQIIGIKEDGRSLSEVEVRAMCHGQALVIR